MADSDRHGDLDEEDRFEDEGRRSIFSALWFRAILVVVVLGVVAAVAVPYLLEWANPQPPQPTTASRPGGMTAPAPPPAAPLAPPPSAPSVTPPPPASPPAAEKPEPAPAPPAVAQEKPAAPVKEKPAAKAPAPAPAPSTSSAPSTGSDKYDVFVSGGVPAEINAKLAAKGLNAEQSSAGLVVKPSLPLRDAVALSKDLAVDGLKVQVRRSGGGASAPAVPSAPAPSAPTMNGDTFYRVRVGPYDARADATSAMQDLEK